MGYKKIILQAKLQCVMKVSFSDDCSKVLRVSGSFFLSPSFYSHFCIASTFIRGYKVATIKKIIFSLGILKHSGRTQMQSQKIKMRKCPCLIQHKTRMPSKTTFLVNSLNYKVYYCTLRRSLESIRTLERSSPSRS